MEYIDKELEIREVCIPRWFLLDVFFEDFRYTAHGLLDGLANHVGVLRSSQVLGVASPNVAVDGNSEVDHVAREELVSKEMCKERDVKSVVDECFLFEVGEGEVICLVWI